VGFWGRLGTGWATKGQLIPVPDVRSWWCRCYSGVMKWLVMLR